MLGLPPCAAGQERAPAGSIRTGGESLPPVPDASWKKTTCPECSPTLQLQAVKTRRTDSVVFFPSSAFSANRTGSLSSHCSISSAGRALTAVGTNTLSPAATKHRQGLHRSQWCVKDQPSTDMTAASKLEAHLSNRTASFLDTRYTQAE